jgi:ABC-type transport system involved in cytochrome bd biosynthesis fused ATPase/permease subunit/uncharacterized membrane protein YbaN (DUF454 family)
MRNIFNRALVSSNTHLDGGVMKKLIFIAFGFIFIVLGAIGVVLPFLPTSPFLLAAAFCLDRGSTRFHSWFTGTKLYRKYIGDYVKSRVMTIESKVKVLAMVSVLILTGCLLTGSLHARIAMGVVLLGHYYYFLVRLKTIPSGKPVSAQKRLLVMVSGARGLLALTVFYRWLSLLCNMAIIWSIADLLQKGFEDHLSGGLIVPISVFLLALLIRHFCIRMSSETSHRAAANAKKTLRDNIYGKLLRMGLSYRSSVSSAAVVQMSVEGVEKLQVYISGYLPQLFYSIFAPLTLFMIFAFVDLKIALALLACVPLIPLLLLLIRKIAGGMMKKHWGAYTDLGKSFLESLQGLTTLKIYNADGKRHKEMNDTAEGFRKTTMRVLRMQLGSVTFMDLIAYGGTALGIVLAVSETVSGQISLGACVFILLLTSEFFLPLRALGSFFHSSMNGIAAAEQIFSLLDAPEPEAGIKEIDSLDVMLSDCSYSYGEGRPALNKLNLHIPFGHFTAIVGESGCGKSTLAKILSGELWDYAGSVKIGGTELSEAAEKSIIRHVSLTEHNAYIFKGTVAKNLSFGCLDASEEEMIDALKKVGLQDFVVAGGGLHMAVSERGANLSGGQRQRLSIARALLHDADIYIFDEVTSGIDPENEVRLMDTLKAMVGRKTVILITHRMKLAECAQSIFVLKDGNAVDYGTHGELYRRSVYYAGLYDTQNDIERLTESDKEAYYV